MCTKKVHKDMTSVSGMSVHPSAVGREPDDKSKDPSFKCVGDDKKEVSNAKYNKMAKKLCEPLVHNPPFKSTERMTKGPSKQNIDNPAFKNTERMDKKKRAIVQDIHVEICRRHQQENENKWENAGKAPINDPKEDINRDCESNNSNRNGNAQENRGK